MKKTIRCCDHCEKEKDTMKDYYETEVIIGYSLFDVDLCEECHEKLIEIIKEYCNKKSLFWRFEYGILVSGC